MSQTSFTAIIENIFRRNGGWTRLKGELSVYYWPRIAGPEIANKVEAIRYRNGLLYLQTENPSLAHQVSLLSLDILKRYRKVLGSKVIKGIKVKIGPVKINPKPNPGVNPAYELTEKERELIRKCSDTLKDDDLGVQFSKLIAAFYRNQKRILAEGGHRCSTCQTAISREYQNCSCCQSEG